MQIVSKDEWEILIEFCKIVRPSAQITAIKSGEKYLTGEDVIFVTTILQQTCQHFVISEISEQAHAFVEALSADIKKETRLGNVKKNTTFSLSNFLDPSYEMADYADHAEARNTRRNVQEMVADQAEARNMRRNVQEMVENMISTNQESEPEPDSGKANNRYESEWSVFDNFMSEKISTKAYPC